MIVYFSGTGNSRYCARFLAQRLGDTAEDATPYLRSGGAAHLTAAQPWVFVCPTYAWRIPRVFRDFLRRSSFSGGKDAYFVMTCGSETGDAQRELPALCAALGLTYRGLFPVAMPDNYLVLFQTPAPEAARESLATVRPRLEEAARLIQRGETLDPLPVKPLDKLKSGIVNQGLYRYFIRTKAFYATDACVGCGKCQALCPLGNIRLQNGRPQWGQNCTHCMACISYCPTKAIEYGKASRGKARYHFPEEL